MKLLKAIEDKLIKSGDFFKTKLDNWFLLKGTFFYHYDPVLEKQKGSANLCIDTLNLEGEIIRAEPEVLTVEQMVTVLNVSLRDTSSFLHSGCYKGAIDRADKNGQIKEYKRLKPLIQCLYDNADELFKEGFESLHAFIKNLTPPWEPEK